jgi:hypothetical protein
VTLPPAWGVVVEAFSPSFSDCMALSISIEPCLKGMYNDFKTKRHNYILSSMDGMVKEIGEVKD